MIRASRVALAVGLGIAFAQPAASQQRLTYASYIPAGHVIHTAGLEPFFDHVEQATDGALTFELFPGGAMGGGKAMLSVVRDRIVDSALIIDIYIKRELPASNAISELALLGEDTMVMNGAVNEVQLLGCSACETERERNDVEGLAFNSTTRFYLMCSRPVGKLADIDGLKVRAIGPFGFWIEALGGAPVSLTSAEIYEGMQRGQIDCTVGSLAWLTSYNLIDVVTDIVDLPMGTYHGAMVFDMNVDTWEALSEEQRACEANCPVCHGASSRPTTGKRSKLGTWERSAVSPGMPLIQPCWTCWPLIGNGNSSA
jgi:TRAP-type C4-dicarboxylate transport system substrate-binding protein